MPFKNVKVVQFSRNMKRNMERLFKKAFALSMAELLIIAHTKNNEVMMIKAPAEEGRSRAF